MKEAFNKVKLEEFIITKPLLYKTLKGLIWEKKVKMMNIKMAMNSQPSLTESK